MYIVKQNDNIYLIESEEDLTRWASDKLDIDDDSSFDGCPYMKFDFKPTGKIKVQEATERQFKLIKKSK